MLLADGLFAVIGAEDEVRIGVEITVEEGGVVEVFGGTAGVVMGTGMETAEDETWELTSFGVDIVIDCACKWSL
jgi:hypothetical protein